MFNLIWTPKAQTTQKEWSGLSPHTSIIISAILILYPWTILIIIFVLVRSRMVTIERITCRRESACLICVRVWLVYCGYMTVTSWSCAQYIHSHNINVYSKYSHSTGFLSCKMKSCSYTVMYIYCYKTYKQLLFSNKIFTNIHKLFVKLVKWNL